VSKQDFSLRQVFADLAQNTGWPWESEQLTMARLALMVVDAEDAAEALGISPSDYANVKERVEAAPN